MANFVPSGVATVAATGDQGYVGTLTPGFDNYPAAFPGVTAAGGTSLAPAASSNARGFSESAWSVTQAPDGPEGGGSGCDVNESRPTYQPNMGCNGRAYADLSADADPNTGLEVVDDGNWGVVGGTSLATPLIAAYYAITGIDDTTSSTSAKWAYTTPDSSLLNDITSGSNGTCSANIPTSARPAPATTGQPAWARFPVPWRRAPRASGALRSNRSTRPPRPARATRTATRSPRALTAPRSRAGSIQTGSTRPGGSSTGRRMAAAASSRLLPPISGRARRPSW